MVMTHEPNTSRIASVGSLSSDILVAFESIYLNNLYYHRDAKRTLNHLTAMENENSDNFVEASGSDNSLQTDSQAAPLCQEIANERNAAHLVSSPRTLMNILRCMVGPGCFALPVSFKMAGLWCVLYVDASPVCPAIMFQCFIHLLRTGHLELDYGHLAKKAFDYGPIAVRNYSKTALYIYLLVIEHNFQTVPLILSPPNRIASLPGYTNLQGLMLAIGSMLYAFEGQAVILPLENKMKNPKDMLGWNGVLSVSMSIVTCVYAATGFFGYATFGNEVKGSITLNMPDTWLYELLYVVVEMLWPAIQRKIRFSQERILFIMEFALHFLAIAIPNLEKIIPFVGVTAGIVLGYVFPPIIAIIIYYDDAFSWSSLHKWWFYGKN
ncbi:transmembrane amino acid transporter protein, partial [Trichinella spiralis]|uniref:transmembrane amino acid transporter protein n=1 Tax=Trichinella spiralis TaxID=6334 RepID=UPI0001EFB722